MVVTKEEKSDLSEHDLELSNVKGIKDAVISAKISKISGDCFKKKR